MALKYLPDNSNIWFISCWHLLVVLFHSGCDCSGSQWNEWVFWIFWILHYKTLNSTSSFLVCILTLKCRKWSEWVYIFTHVQMWDPDSQWFVTDGWGGSAVSLGPLKPYQCRWGISSDWGFPLRDTRGLVVPSLHHFFPPLDVSSLLDPLTLEWGCEAGWWWDSLPSKSRPHWYHLGRAVKAPSAFVGQEVNINSPQSRADIHLVGESEILPVLARWELEESPPAWPCWRHWLGRLNYHCLMCLCWG